MQDVVPGIGRGTSAHPQRPTVEEARYLLFCSEQRASSATRGALSCQVSVSRAAVVLLTMVQQASRAVLRWLDGIRTARESVRVSHLIFFSIITFAACKVLGRKPFYVNDLMSEKKNK
jgi:hypothetical protein